MIEDIRQTERGHDMHPAFGVIQIADQHNLDSTQLSSYDSGILAVTDGSE